MAGFVVVGLAILLIWFFVSLLAPLLVRPFAAITGISIDTTFITLYFFIFATLYNCTLLSLLAITDRARLRREGEALDHRFTIMIPARNEETVLEEPLHRIMAVEYPREKFEVFVVNDGSTDGTRELLWRVSKRYDNFYFYDIRPDDSGQGKSTALNRGFSFLLEHSRFRNDPEWIIGVFDADGVPEINILRKASFQFGNPKIGALQATVRMINRSEGLLEMLQDIEFVTFAKITQFVRSIFRGAVALGGNGQFVRAGVLKAVALAPGEYWRTGALTEDLELGTRILLKGWDNAFLATTAVYQQAVRNFRALYRQRTRWGWGSLQTFRMYVLSLRVFRERVSFVKKVDMGYYLFFTLIPLLILLTWILTGLNLASILTAYNPFPAIFMIANAVSFFPLIAYGLWVAREDYRPYAIVPLLFLVTAYTYHWIPCMLRAALHMLMRDRPRWIKTERVELTPVVALRETRLSDG